MACFEVFWKSRRCLSCALLRTYFKNDKSIFREADAFVGSIMMT